jgi:pimeloyl-ACP methyl ester carboxylesterase
VIFPGAAFTAAQISGAVKFVLDSAYQALWAIRSNDPGWRASRAALGWIAVSGFDDTPHRPVNVPTAPYPQFDIKVTVPLTFGGAKTVGTRYMIASAGTFVGPNDGSSSFRAPSSLLLAPAGALPAGPVPRTLPPSAPAIPAGNKVIVYIHGGGSRAEEAVDMANWLILEGAAKGENYTVVSFDLPNSAYGESFDASVAFQGSYDFQQRNILIFERDFVTAFIDALNVELPGVANQIVGVMGGSLGGNLSALLTARYDPAHKYLQTIVAWSITAMAPANYLGVIPAADLAVYLDGMQGQVTQKEPPDDHGTEASYIQKMYSTPLVSSPVLTIPAQPIMWYRGGYSDGTGRWQPCKDESIARSRFDRYEIYSPFSRRWTTAIDLEQISFSFQGQTNPILSLTFTAAQGGLPASRVMLVAGDNDNFFPNEIYNSTIDFVNSIRMSGQGKAEFWLDTGHSIHNERPRLFASEILYFLDNPTAGDSPNGVAVPTPPKAANSVVDQ